jgi:hypothetical protein
MAKLKTKKTTPKKFKVLTALKSGKTVTRKNAQSQFKVKNLRATIFDLRTNGGYNKNILTGENKDGSVKYTWKN